MLLIFLQDERHRIEELGGCVIWIGDWRVNGNIAVSRSIGDKDHKPFVSADPDTFEFDLEGKQGNLRILKNVLNIS